MWTFPFFPDCNLVKVTLVGNTKCPATEQLKDPFSKGSNLFLLNGWLWFSIFLKTMIKLHYGKSREESEMLNIFDILNIPAKTYKGIIFERYIDNSVSPSSSLTL